MTLDLAFDAFARTIGERYLELLTQESRLVINGDGKVKGFFGPIPIRHAIIPLDAGDACAVARHRICF